MDIDALKKAIKEEIESDNFTLQSIFDRYLPQIEALKKSGFTYAKINTKLDAGIRINHFRTLIERAKTKKEDHNSSPNKVKNNLINKKDVHHQEPLNPIMNNGILNQSVEEWYQETGITLSPELAERIENNGLNSDDVNNLSLTTKQKLINYLAKLENQSKYK